MNTLDSSKLLQEFLLAFLGRTIGDYGRFRSIYVTEHHIVVHTRNGGGNREEYGCFLEDYEHPWYSHNEEDCDYDDTYADIYYEVPSEHKEFFSKLAATNDISEAWDIAKQYVDLMGNVK
jgi:hypothetical protein